MENCRYYKGEKENSYKGKDRNKAMLWFYERGWCLDLERGREPADSEMLHIVDYYKLSSLDVDIPKSLLALLFNRYARDDWSVNDAVEPFKLFIKKYYQK